MTLVPTNFLRRTYVMVCAVWNYLHDLKNVKNTHGGMILKVKLQIKVCNVTKSNTAPWVFLTFSKLKNGTKSHNIPHTKN